MQKHLATTRKELEHHIRCHIYKQVIDGDGWVVFERAFKIITERQLDAQIDNRSGEDIYSVYEQLFNNGFLDGVNGIVFKRRDYLRSGEASTEIQTFLYTTEKQLRNFYRKCSKAKKNRIIDFEEHEPSHAAERYYS